MKFDESDNIVVRAARSVTDTLTDRFGIVILEDLFACSVVAHSFSPCVLCADKFMAFSPFHSPN